MGVLLKRKSVCLERSKTFSVLGFLKEWFFLSIVEQIIIPLSMELSPYYITLMKKEELKFTSETKPIKISFIPLSLQLPFNLSLRLQLAFYRADKACKTKTQKYSKPTRGPHVELEPEKLNFCTTVSYKFASASFESKLVNKALTQIDVQLACEADGKRQQLTTQFDLKDYVKLQTSFEQESIVLSFSPEIRLTFKLVGNFLEGLPANPPQAENTNPKDDKAKQNGNAVRKKIIKFKDEEQKQGLEPPEALDRKKQRNNTFTSEEKKISPFDRNAYRSEKICKEGSKSTSKADKQPSIQNSTKKIRDLEQESEKYAKQMKEMKENFQSLQKRRQKLEKKVQQYEQKLALQQEKIKQLQKLNSELSKNKQDDKTILNKLKESQALIQKKNARIKKLEDEIEKHLLKQTEQFAKYEALQASQREMRSKYQESQKKNVALTSEISESKYSEEKSRKQNANLQQKIKALEKQHEQELSELKQLSTANTDDKIKAEVERLKKELLKKEEMIKILGESKENAKSEAKLQQDILKRENSEMREELDHIKKAAKGGDELELKVMNERLRRECDQVKKMEKGMLIEKAALKSQNDSMHEQIMKLKETIAKMLNLIQEESQELFTLVTDCIC